jgi:hypothetical protein
MPPSRKKKKKRTSQSSPDVRMAVYRAARGVGTNKKPTIRGQNIKSKSTPTTSVTRGRGTSTGTKSRSVRPPRPYYWETSDKGGLPRRSSVGGSRSN